MAGSRSHAADLIAAGRVTVGGAPATSASRLVRADEAVAVQGEPEPFVSRGGRKLAHALDAFGIDPSGTRALDVGASTGGFTDCLLQRGAAAVVALDVGRGQLAWSIRSDPRVEVHERTNVRHVHAGDLGAPFALVVVDVSFISLLTIAPNLVELAAADADVVLLVKPQFEAGPSRVGRGGIVRDAGVRRTVLGEVVAGLEPLGLGAREVVASPITGADGNVEFLLWARPGGRTLAEAALDDVAGRAAAGPGEAGPTGPVADGA